MSDRYHEGRRPDPVDPVGGQAVPSGRDRPPLLPRPRESPERCAPVDPAFLAFLLDRLNEEILAATHRRLSGAGAGAATHRALRFLDELVSGLRGGVLPEPSELRILTTLYATHPAFRAEWLRVA